MGCDGGTIPRRNELVRMKKKPEQKDKDAERSFKWRNCAMSQEPLEKPVVACGLGRLYSKINVVEALLDKESMPESVRHIRNLKDIKNLKLTKNPAYVETEHKHGNGSAPYICPISGIEMSGKFRFIFLWSCGCVLAERALKEVKQHLCHMCQQPFTDNDVVVLNGTDEDIEQLQAKMAVRVASRKNTKKSKAETAVRAEIKVEPTSNGYTETTVKVEPQEYGSISDTNEPQAGCSSRVKQEIGTIPLSLPKFNPNKRARGHFGSDNRVPYSDLADEYESYKKARRDYSIAKDPQNSEVFKSLFTSHKTHKEQQRAHWVTYNPFYN